jgi:hypothetical protein
MVYGMVTGYGIWVIWQGKYGRIYDVEGEGDLRHVSFIDAGPGLYIF